MADSLFFQEAVVLAFFAVHSSTSYHQKELVQIFLVVLSDVEVTIAIFSVKGIRRFSLQNFVWSAICSCVKNVSRLNEGGQKEKSRNFLVVAGMNLIFIPYKRVTFCEQTLHTTFSFLNKS